MAIPKEIVTNIIVGLFIIVLFYFKRPILERLQIHGLSQILNNIRFSMSDIIRSIVIPIGISVCFFIILGLVNITITGLSTGESVLVYILNSIMIAPISEEIIQCIFLSEILLISNIVFQKTNANIFLKYFINIAGLLLISMIFTYYHYRLGIFWLITFLQFIIYGLLFYLNDRNILPPIVCHASWNTILLLGSVI